MRDIGKNIKTLRQAKNMTQETLADALYVTRQTVSNYENGRSRPDLDTLLRIAEILETDINTVIYGPPVPKNKKESRKWAAISLGLLVIIWAVYFVINARFNKLFPGYVYSIRLINMEAVLPAGMFLLGWVLLHILSLFTGLSQFNGKRAKAVRILLLITGCVAAAVPIPYIIFHGVAAYRSLTAHSVSMVFPNVPVLTGLFKTILLTIDRAPFVYCILGGLFWLFGLPPTKAKETSTEE